MDSIDSRLQKIETGEQPRDRNPYKVIWKLEKFSVIVNNDKLFEETRNKKGTDPNLARNYCSTAFRSQPYGYSFFFRAYPYGCGSAIGRQMSITISLIAGTFDDVLSWPLKRTIQNSVSRQDNSGLFWTNLLKTIDKTTPCFSRPSPLQTSPSCGIFF